MAIILGPDWNRLYDEGKCLDRGVPFTDEQQAELFKNKDNPAKQNELIIKWRAEFEASKLEDPKQVQAQANAVAIKNAMEKKFLFKNVGEDEVEEPKDRDYSSLSYNDLKALAKKKGIDLGKSPKKDDIVHALEGLGD